VGTPEELVRKRGSASLEDAFISYLAEAAGIKLTEKVPPPQQVDASPVNGAAELPVTAQLCIGCLEDRLGRKLTHADFQYTIGERSERPEDRTKDLRAETMMDDSA
jgi:hypothetical protein